MKDVIDSVIAEVTAQPETPETPDDTPEAEGETTENHSDDNSDGEQEEVAFPKKAVNALSRRDKKIGKLQAELAALRAEQAKWTSPQPNQATPQNKPETNAAPREEDFESYGDYLKASMRHEIMAEIQKQQQTSAEGFQKQQADFQRQQYEAERTQVIVEQMQSHKDAIPDFAEVVSEYADIADELPKPIADLFFEADDAALAFYNLAKEGKLEALATMSPSRAAIEIAKAQINKPQLKKVSSAPSPISGVSGRSSGTKSFDRMSGDELMKTLGIKY